MGLPGVLRAALAGVCIIHGLPKLTNLSMYAEMLPISFTATLFVALAELSGGVLILIGGLGASKEFDLVTRAGAALNILVMFGAIRMVYRARWNFVPSESHPMGGMQFQVTLLLILVFFVLVGNDRRDDRFTQAI
ncbi:MAG: DoxX family protein [Rhodobacteraceae bacterium]|nr:DoxX family protein [Paracoccaceae bacterium]